MQSILLFEKKETSLRNRYFYWIGLIKPYIDLQTSGTTGIPKMIRTNK
jgi:acyl-coenzyme A synthetase/AMP-(fatty) acid ligase